MTVSTNVNQETSDQAAHISLEMYLPTPLYF